MTIAKNPRYKAGKRIQREFKRYNVGDISFEEYTRRVASIKEYYEV